MNANFGILPEIDEKIKDKKIRYEQMAMRSLKEISNITKYYINVSKILKLY